MLSLTKTFLFAILISARGEMSEWFKELVLKTSDSARNRGFESHSLRQKEAPPIFVGCFFLPEWVNEPTFASRRRGRIGFAYWRRDGRRSRATCEERLAARRADTRTVTLFYRGSFTDHAVKIFGVAQRIDINFAMLAFVTKQKGACGIFHHNAANAVF